MVVAGNHVVALIETPENRGINIDLKALRPEIVLGAVAHQARTPAECDVPEPAEDRDRVSIDWPAEPADCRLGKACT